MAVAADVVPDAADAGALRDALEASRRLSEAAAGLRAENALLREQVAGLLERVAERDAELEKLRADLTVLRRMLFGRSSEKSRCARRPAPGPRRLGQRCGARPAVRPRPRDALAEPCL